VTHRRTWQRREGRVAALLGALRQPLSGSSGRGDQTASDSTHPRLFVECKYRTKHAARTLFDAVRRAAREEKKLPVLALADRGRPGVLICVHSDDLLDFVAELAAAGGDPPSKAARCE
jgi:hypothetical protein